MKTGVELEVIQVDNRWVWRLWEIDEETYKRTPALGKRCKWVKGKEKTEDAALSAGSMALSNHTYNLKARQRSGPALYEHREVATPYILRSGAY